MKYSFAAAVLSLLAGFQVQADSLVNKIECRVTMSTMSGQIVVHGTTREFRGDNFRELTSSFVSIPLGDLTLSSGISLSSPDGVSPIVPTFSAHLYRGNPVQGSLEFMRVQGLDVLTRADASPVTLYGLQFVNLIYEGQRVSRVDFSCSLKRVN